MSGKQFGLLLPKKQTGGMSSKHAVFGDDSDSDSSGGKRARREVTQQIGVKKQTKWDMQKALDQDATVYQYDEVYDQMELERTSKTKPEKERKPKYIQKLLETAERRKVEHERRIERQVQKEREAEGDEFKDKETFVTSAYKKKLEEFAELDKEQQHMDMLEDIGDVTKQQDISGFYRHLYETTVDPKPESEKRQYRKHKDSASSADPDEDLDLSDSSMSSSDDSYSGSESPKSEKTEEKETAPEAVLEEEPPPPPQAPEEPKVNIWEKRTIGPVFDEALKRYLLRKHERERTA